MDNIDQIRGLAERLQNTQEALAKEKVEATGASDAIRVVALGNQLIHRIYVAPEYAQATPVKELAEQIRLVVNEAIKKSQALAQQRLKTIAGGVQRQS